MTDGSGAADQATELASEASSPLSTPGADTISTQQPVEPAQSAATSDSVNSVVTSNAL